MTTSMHVGPLPEYIGALVRSYGELEYVSGHEMAKRLLRLQLGLSVQADSDSRYANDRERVEKRREELIDAIREAL